MTSLLAQAGAIGALTDEQRIAAATPARNVFIEAGPGTGKTTVSAQRVGVQRFAHEHRSDHRAVVAVSFTRAATKNLRQRVQRLWGPSALAWPHRIVTLDAVMSDLLHDLLRSGLMLWPNAASLWPDGNVTLDVRDSWASCGGTVWTKSIYRLGLVAGQIEIRPGFASERDSRVPAVEVIPHLRSGICTHEDVRDLLGQALHDPAMAERIRQRLGTTMRALVVDEVFDANDLDLAIIDRALRAGVDVTLVGDPWQALYLFRGARPQAVPELLERANIRTLRLTQSFRWRSEEQRQLATDLRNGSPVVLPVGVSDDLDVVLGLWWKDLWEIGGGVLPLAFHSFKGGYEEAAATLLLNYVTRSIFEVDATYLNDSLTALNIQDRTVLQQLEPAFQEVVDILRPGGKGATDAAYLQLVEVVKGVSERELRRPHHEHTKRLGLLQQRLAFTGRPVPGLTTHQAKGGEWEAVGVRLRDGEREALAAGLSSTEDTHRKLYVACTRAHRTTVEVPPAPAAAPKRKSRKRRPS